LANAEEGATLYLQARVLREAGLGHKEIGQRLGVSARTIGRWLSQGYGPATQRRSKKPSQLDRFVPYLLHRWADGCRNGRVLHQEVRDRGYRGGTRTVYKFLQSLRASPPPSPRPKTTPLLSSPLDGVTPRHVVRWLVQPAKERESRTTEILNLIGQANSEVAQAQILVEEFLTLARTLQGSDLEHWLERVKATRVKELQQFAHGLERDKAAVVAGLTLLYSTGPVEGHINRLKLLRRQSYGRAGIAHLSRRLLAA
jgi:transposase